MDVEVRVGGVELSVEHNYEVKQPHSQPSITVWELVMRLGEGGSGGGCS